MEPKALKFMSPLNLPPAEACPQQQDGGIATSLDQLHENNQQDEGRVQFTAEQGRLDSNLWGGPWAVPSESCPMLRWHLPSHFIHETQLVCKGSLPTAEDDLKSPGISLVSSSQARGCAHMASPPRIVWVEKMLLLSKATSHQPSGRKGAQSPEQLWKSQNP